ncbi:MAG TPA: amidohydrolase [Actinomycetota bacterium]|nr:amidohydrolase [Actinomycetota bacterium]
MTIVRAELVFAEDRWRRGGAFAMAEGVILATGPPEELGRRFPDHPVEDWGHVAVLPGCVNGHDHSFQVLLRGLGDDLSFLRWRDRVLYPFSERLDRDAIRAGALLDLAELARAGVTTSVDFFYLHDRGNANDLAVAEAAREVGIRLVLARSMYDWTGAPARYLETPEEAVANLRALARELRDDPLVRCQPAPHSIHGASPGMIRAGAELAAELGVPFHIHVAEGRYEREMALERYGRTPVGFLDSLGVLSERTVMVHCVWVDEEDLAIMAERGARVVHNPSANAFLGDGVAPLREMLARGIPVCLGTDGGCTNSRRSVFEEMRMAALLAKARAADAEALTAEQVLLAGTARGGEVLGLPVGRIAPGYLADLVVLDLDALSLQPAATAEKQVVYAMQPEAIRRVLVGGEPIVEEGRLVRVDEAAIRDEVARATAGWVPPPR